jgi:hypothetical protein
VPPAARDCVALRDAGTLSRAHQAADTVRTGIEGLCWGPVYARTLAHCDTRVAEKHVVRSRVGWSLFELLALFQRFLSFFLSWACFFRQLVSFFGKIAARPVIGHAIWRGCRAKVS